MPESRARMMPRNHTPEWCPGITRRNDALEWCAGVTAALCRCYGGVAPVLRRCCAGVAPVLRRLLSALIIRSPRLTLLWVKLNTSDYRTGPFTIRRIKKDINAWWIVRVICTSNKEDFLARNYQTITFYTFISQLLRSWFTNVQKPQGKHIKSGSSD